MASPRDRDARTGHHLECRAASAALDSGPYRSEARGARAAAAAVAAARAEQRAAVARRLATGRWVQQDGSPASNGDQCAFFRPELLSAE